jgi:transcriptional regulator with XRE-family HTH domain
MYASILLALCSSREYCPEVFSEYHGGWMMTEPKVLTQLKALGLTQEQIAKALGVPKGTVSNWRTGTRNISVGCLLDLRELLLLAQERTEAGMDVHQAIADWRPTGLEHPGMGRSESTGLAFEVDERTARQGFEAMQRERLRQSIEALAREQGEPLTVERLMYLRRLSLEVKLAAEALQFYRLEHGKPRRGKHDAGHQQG